MDYREGLAIWQKPSTLIGSTNIFRTYGIWLMLNLDTVIKATRKKHPDDIIGLYLISMGVAMKIIDKFFSYRVTNLDI